MGERFGSRPASILARLRSLAAASAWTSILARALLGLVGLGALAWVGRIASIHSASASPARGDGVMDAGGLPPPAASDVSPAPPPPVTTAPPAATTALPAGNTHRRATVDDPVYINYASAEELARLPGAGPKRAEAIVMLRQRMGRFQRVEDLLRVKGIGRATLRKWRPLVRLDAPQVPVHPDASAP